jgi:hypothetical protein
MAEEIKPDDLYSVVITVPDERMLQRVLTLPGIDAGCRHPNVHRESGRFQLAALVRGAQLPELQRQRGFEVNVVENATEAGRRYFEYVGRGNRFKNERVVPRGAGKLI